MTLLQAPGSSIPSLPPLLSPTLHAVHAEARKYSSRSGAEGPSLPLALSLLPPHAQRSAHARSLRSGPCVGGGVTGSGSGMRDGDGAVVLRYIQLSSSSPPSAAALSSVR